MKIYPEPVFKPPVIFNSTKPVFIHFHVIPFGQQAIKRVSAGGDSILRIELGNASSARQLQCSAGNIEISLRSSDRQHAVCIKMPVTDAGEAIQVKSEEVHESFPTEQVKTD